MDWCRLECGYYRDPAVVRAGEAAEVLFTRMMGYCAEHETGGVVPRAALPLLTPTKTKLRVDALIREGLVLDVGNDVVLRSWERIQEALDSEADRRRKDRERKAAQRDRRRSEGWEVYRAYNDADELLYVGQSNNLKERLSQHGYESHWWPQTAWVSLEAANTAREAMAIEMEAIAQEKPLYNRSPGHAAPAGWVGRQESESRRDSERDARRDSGRDARLRSARIDVEVEEEQKTSSSVAAADPPTTTAHRLVAEIVPGPLPRQQRARLYEVIDQLVADAVPEARIRVALTDWTTRADVSPGLLPHLVPRDVLEEATPW